MQPAQHLNWPILWDGVALIAARETCVLRAYKCPAGTWTCGWGETDGVGPGMVWTQEYADRRLCDSLAGRAHAIRTMCTVAPTEHQLAALVSLAYNIGLGALRKSTVMRCHNRGDHAAAARAFALWNKATINGKLTVLNGLVSRRAAEAALYLLPDPELPPEPMPQTVATERSMGESRIVQTNVVAGATGLVAAAAEYREYLGPLGSALTTLRGLVTGLFEAVGIQINPQHALPLALALGAGITLWHRWQQRRQGQA